MEAPPAPPTEGPGLLRPRSPQQEVAALAFRSIQTGAEAQARLVAGCSSSRAASAGGEVPGGHVCTSHTEPGLFYDSHTAGVGSFQWRPLWAKGCLHQRLLFLGGGRQRPLLPVPTGCTWRRGTEAVRTLFPGQRHRPGELCSPRPGGTVLFVCPHPLGDGSEALILKVGKPGVLQGPCAWGHTLESEMVCKDAPGPSRVDPARASWPWEKRALTWPWKSRLLPAGAHPAALDTGGRTHCSPAVPELTALASPAPENSKGGEPPEHAPSGSQFPRLLEGVVPAPSKGNPAGGNGAPLFPFLQRSVFLGSWAPGVSLTGGERQEAGAWRVAVSRAPRERLPGDGHKGKSQAVNTSKLRTSN